MTSFLRSPRLLIDYHKSIFLLYLVLCPLILLIYLLLDKWLQATSEDLGPIIPRVENWMAPSDWDPVKPIYTGFPSLDSRFGPSMKNLERRNETSTETQLYELYLDHQDQENKNDYVPCYGPRGIRLQDSLDDKVKAYEGYPKGFPKALLGSSVDIGIDQETCFERFGRYSPYGLASSPSPIGSLVDWNHVNWDALQKACVADNSRRFDLMPRQKPAETETIPVKRQKRTAIIFRSYDGMKYTPDTLRNMRSIITELCLDSGGEYVAFLLVHVKDEMAPIFKDPTLYEQFMAQKVPKEFRNITLLWNEALWPELYPLLSKATINVHISQWLPVQWFALKYSNFDHYWNWEMDIRYTGHHYELLQALHSWTTKQPRKGLWERNARFWIPSFHGNYTQFRDKVQARYVTGPGVDTSIWGPQYFPGQRPREWDIYPPKHLPTPVADDFDWGVGEDADFVSLLPIFNPDTTHYALKDAYYNYRLDCPPRRTTIITFFRLSNRLLNIMHLENSRTPGRHMSSETWPQSVALHHGLKAVYAPHSIYTDREWPADAANFIFNSGDTQEIIQGFDSISSSGEGSGGWESVFGLGREHNFDSFSWYYRTSLATRLYKRFLGYEVDGIGGPQWEKEHGTYCLPPMLLHQIKSIQDPTAP